MHLSSIAKFIIAELLHIYCIIVISHAYVMRPTSLKRETTSLSAAEDKSSLQSGQTAQKSTTNGDKSYRIINLDQIVQLHDIDTGLFVSIKQGTNKLVLSDQSQSIRSLYELTPASSVDDTYPGDAWLIRSMFKTNRYICQNKKGVVYLSKLKAGCLMHKVISAKGVVFYNYKRWTKLVVNRIEPNEFVSKDAVTNGQMDIVPAPWTLKALVTDLAFELYTSTQTLSSIIKSRLDQSDDPNFTLASLIDPLKGEMETTLVTLTKYDWMKASRFDASDHDWKTLVSRELPFITPIVHYQVLS